MPQVTANDISLEVVTEGDPKNETILLIMGLATQLTAWPVTFRQQLVDHGYHVVCFDNRDIGLSQRMSEHGAPNIPLHAVMKALNLPVPLGYRLRDMAADAVGVLDALNIERAHVVGASMGGMIAQLVAGHYPERVLSLTSIMSTTGHRSLPRSDFKATRAMLLKPDDPNDIESIIERNARVRRTLQSKTHPKTDQEIWDTAAAAVQRGGYNPAGVARQLAAIIASKQRRPLLQSITAPALVIHGDEDPLVKLDCGIDTAEHLPNAELCVMEGMGHDLPTPLLEEMAQRIHQTAQRAR